MLENEIVANLINNQDFTRKVLPHLKEEYFSDEPNKWLFNNIREYVGKYNVNPTVEAMAIILTETPMNEMLFEQLKSRLTEVKDCRQHETKWLMGMCEKWAQDRAIYNALSESIAIQDGSNKTLDKNAIPGILQAALSVQFDSNIGHDYFADAEKQWEYVNSDDTRFPFAQDTLNRITKGGVGKKTLNIFGAGINVGKTTALIDQAAHWLEQGKNVLYFTLEVAENVIRLRSDVRLMNRCFDDMMGLSKEDYLGTVNQFRSKTRGEFIIKEFPSGAAHVGHFRHVIEEVILKKGFRPDVIIVDYLTIMASSKLPSAARGNSNTYFTSVAEELRSLAVDYDVPVWTAIQFGRNGQTSDNVDMTDVALAIGIAATADFMLAFMQPEEMAAMNKVVGRVLKNRYANKSKIGKFLMGLDNDYQKLYDLAMDQQREVMDEAEQEAFKGVSTPAPNESSNMSTWTFN